jgi:hypothetical protein
VSFSVFASVLSISTTRGTDISSSREEEEDEEDENNNGFLWVWMVKDGMDWMERNFVGAVVQACAVGAISNQHPTPKQRRRMRRRRKMSFCRLSIMRFPQKRCFG